MLALLKNKWLLLPEKTRVLLLAVLIAVLATPFTRLAISYVADTMERAQYNNSSMTTQESILKLESLVPTLGDSRLKLSPNQAVVTFNNVAPSALSSWVKTVSKETNFSGLDVKVSSVYRSASALPTTWSGSVTMTLP